MWPFGKKVVEKEPWEGMTSEEIQQFMRSKEREAKAWEEARGTKMPGLFPSYRSSEFGRGDFKDFEEPRGRSFKSRLLEEFNEASTEEERGKVVLKYTRSRMAHGDTQAVAQRRVYSILMGKSEGVD